MVKSLIPPPPNPYRTERTHTKAARINIKWEMVDDQGGQITSGSATGVPENIAYMIAEMYRQLSIDSTTRDLIADMYMPRSEREQLEAVRKVIAMFKSA